MTDFRRPDATDREHNFAFSDNASFGITYPETIFRELFDYSFKNLRVSPNRDSFIDSLFKKIPQKTVAEFKTWLGAVTNLTVVENWPKKTTSIPFIAVVDAGTRETNPFLGDSVGEGCECTTFAVRDSSTTQIFVSTEDSLSCWFLSQMVRITILVNKMRLVQKQGIDNVVVNMQDFRWTPEYHPTECYTRVVQLTYETEADWSIPEALVRDVLVCPSVEYNDVNVHVEE